MGVITSTAVGGLANVGGTWVGGVPPGATDSVVIATTGTGKVTWNLDHSAQTTCLGITINAGAHLEHLAGTVISPAGNYTINGKSTLIPNIATPASPTTIRFVLASSLQYGIVIAVSTGLCIWGNGSGEWDAYANPLVLPIKLTTSDPDNYKMAPFSFGTYFQRNVPIGFEWRNILFEAISGLALGSPNPNFIQEGNWTFNKMGNQATTNGLQGDIVSSNLRIWFYNVACALPTNNVFLHGYGVLSFVTLSVQSNYVCGYSIKAFDRWQVVKKPTFVMTGSRYPMYSCWFHNNSYLELDFLSDDASMLLWSYIVFLNTSKLKVINYRNANGALIYNMSLSSSDFSYEIDTSKVNLGYFMATNYYFMPRSVKFVGIVHTMTIYSAACVDRFLRFVHCVRKERIIESSSTVTPSALYDYLTTAPIVYITNQTSRSAIGRFYFPVNPSLNFLTLTGTAIMSFQANQISFPTSGDTATMELQPWNVSAWLTTTIVKSATNLTVEFRISTNNGISYGDWTALTTANIAALIPAANGQDRMQIRATATGVATLTSIDITFNYTAGSQVLRDINSSPFDVSPNILAIAGGEAVTLSNGYNFNQIQGTGKVYFVSAVGVATEATVLSWSDMVITCTSPALAAGTYSIKVVNSDGDIQLANGCAVYFDEAGRNQIPDLTKIPTTATGGPAAWLQLGISRVGTWDLLAWEALRNIAAGAAFLVKGAQERVRNVLYTGIYETMKITGLSRTYSLLTGGDALVITGVALKATGASTVKVGTVSAIITSQTDTEIVIQTPVQSAAGDYKIEITRSDGVVLSQDKGYAYVSLYSAPATPTLTLVPLSSSRIQVRWTWAILMARVYIERSEDGETGWVVFDPITSGNSYDDGVSDPLDADSYYYYRCRSWNEQGYSEYSEIKRARTLAEFTAAVDPLKVQMEEDLNDVFFNVENGFAEDVQIVPASGAPAYVVKGIFDNEYESVSVDTEQPVMSTQPGIRIRERDLQAPLNRLDTLTVRGILYKIVTNQPDGVGTILLTLHKA